VVTMQALAPAPAAMDATASEQALIASVPREGEIEEEGKAEEQEVRGRDEDASSSS
jgi:hypothetical protein